MPDSTQYTFVYHNRGWGKVFGLYILRSSSRLAITTNYGVELFDYNLNQAGKVGPLSGKPVKQAHFVAGSWFFLVINDDGSLSLDTG
jgi:hypothetical protein